MASVVPLQPNRWCWNLERTFYTFSKKIVLSLTQIQRWIWEEQLCEIKLQRLCHGNPSMNSTTTPSISGKCSSLTTKPMMLKFVENLLHLLRKNNFKFGTNPMVDLGGTTIWNKSPKVLSWKSFHEFHYNTLHFRQV
jgi:hypothetical protein